MDDKHAPRSQTLRNIALTSKRFNNLARTALYHTVTFRWDNMESVELLLRTLCQQRAASDLILDLNVYGWETEADVELDRATLHAPSSELTLLYDEALTSVNLPQEVKHRIQQGLFQGLQDAQISLLVLLCRKLRRLCLQLPYLSEGVDCILIETFRAAACSQAGPGDDTAQFSRLREIHLAHWDTENTTNISKCTAFLGPSTLHTLVLEQIDWEDGKLDGIRCSAQNVILKNSLIDAEGLEDLLKTCSNAKRLSIVFGEALYGDVHIDFAAFASVLQEHGADLVALKLDCEDALGPHDDSEAYLGSLSALKTLEHLAVPPRALFVRQTWEGQPDPDHIAPEFANDASWLVHTMPTSLKTLEVLESYEDRDPELHEAQISELMHHPSFTALETVIIYAREKPLPASLDQSGWHVSSVPATISRNGVPFRSYTLSRVSGGPTS